MKKHITVALLLLLVFCFLTLLTGCDGLLKKLAKDITPAISDTEAPPTPETTVPEATVQESTTPETEPAPTTEPTTTEAPKPPQYTIDLIGEFPTLSVVGAGKFSRDGSRIIANNADVGDTGLLRPVKLEPGEHVLIEVSAIIQEGTAFGIMIGETDYTNSFKTGWFCLNADIKIRASRLFGGGAGKAKPVLGNAAAKINDRHLATGVETHLAMEILPDNMIRVFYNGVEYTDDTVVFEDYDGGYPGIMTYFGKVEFLSATLTYIGKEGP